MSPLPQFNASLDLSSPRSVPADADYARNRKWTLIGIYIAVFFMMLSGQINDVVIARYVVEEFHASTTLYSWILSIMNLGKVLTILPFSMLSDKIGRKKVLILAFVFYLLGAGMAVIAPTPGWFLFGRFIKGFSSFEGVGLALINEYYPEGKRGKPISLVMAFLSLGMIVGVILGGFFIDWFTFFHAFLILFSITLIPVMAVAILVVNSPRQEELLDPNLSWGTIRRVVGKLRYNTDYIKSLTSITLFSFCIYGIYQHGLYVVLNYFQYPNAHLWHVYLPFLLISTMGSLFFGKIEHPLRIIRISSFIFTLSLLSVIILAIWDAIWIFGVLLLVWGLFQGILYPTMDNYVTWTISTEFQGLKLGIYKTLQMLGMTLGGIVAGYLGDFSWVYSPYVLFAVLTSVAFLVMRRASQVP